MEITQIHHVVLRVQDLEQAMGDFKDKLGIELTMNPVAGRGAQGASLHLSNGQFFELIQPVGEEGKPIAQALEKRGEGVHLVSLATADPKKAREEMHAKGVRTLDDPNKTDGSFLVHPADAHGLLLSIYLDA